MSNDNLKWATDVCTHVRNEAIRWGKMYTVEKDVKFTATDIAKAAGIIAEMVTGDAYVPKEELTLANRQLTAAKAREGKLKKQLEQLKVAK